VIRVICGGCGFVFTCAVIIGENACPKCSSTDLRVAAFPDAAEIDRMVRSDREMGTGENDSLEVE
jgi:predicted Zn-ribbon and HTH transcriptional regulator